MRLLVVGLALLAGAYAQHQQSQEQGTHGRITSSAARPVIHRQPSSEITISSFGPTSSGSYCFPSPCGPNTRCQLSRSGQPQCRCLSGYVPDDNTIVGCKHQCEYDDDCPDDFRCSSKRCVRVCDTGACGLHAQCQARRHRAVCHCPPNYRGDPHTRCTEEEIEIREIAPAPPIDPCYSNPCGINADCRSESDRAVCTCPFGYSGDPLTQCNRGECVENTDCPGHRLCRELRCYDPCLEKDSFCGRNAECQVRQHQVICSCGRDYVGDGLTGCQRFDPSTLCRPSPCGPNTNCQVKDKRAVCSCIENYIGNPLTGCRPECERDADCGRADLSCRNNLCVNPCRGACGRGAYCDVRNGQAICSCPEFYQGNPQSSCYAECTQHEDCPAYQACDKLKCVNPCVGACGHGADCKVEDHKPICSCPKETTGHPFEGCRPFTDEDYCNPNPCGTNAECQPGHDRSGEKRAVCTCPTRYIGNPLTACTLGDCERDSECPDHRACYHYECKNPCVAPSGSVCGENAECTVKDHMPRCSCPVGYEGDPLIECRLPRHGRYPSGKR